jgi:exopolysaccharide biosynthesis polyprenyl glycosylphosphotransferase
VIVKTRDVVHRKTRSATKQRRVPSTPPTAPTPPATRQLAPGLFAATVVVADVAALAGGLFLTYWLRFRLFPAPLGVPTLASYVAALAVVVPLGVAVFRSHGLYHPRRPATFLRDLGPVTRATAMTCVLLAAVAFFYREFSFSRTMLLGYGFVLAGLAIAFRRVAAAGHRALRRRGIGVQRVAIVGGGEMAERLGSKIRSRPGSGLAVVAALEGDDWDDPESGPSLRALRPGRVRAFAKANRVDRVLVTDPDLTYDERLDLVEACHGDGIRCDFVPDLFEVMLGRIRVEEIDGVPLVGVRLHPLDRIDRIKKRTLDILASAAGLVVLSPLLGLLAAVVKLDSAGPVIYRQRRLGRDGREFDLLKFRSMPVAAEGDTGPVWTTREDVRATRIGRVLRRTSLDELPQLWNVLKGEMSLVGPRPERRFFVDQFRRDVPRYLERQGVKSGITGWAQANGLRGDTSVEERTRYDIWYVENWSLGLDLKILVLTLFRFLFQEEAY